MDEERELLRAAEALDRAQLVAVSSGAGISQESGVPTFRDAQTGLWARYDPEQLATPQAFRRDPDLVWSWYMHRRDMVNRAEPNAGHYALVELEEMVPSLVVLTQNVDGLHARAGSRDVVELHGSLHRFKCFDDCRGEPTWVDLASIEHDHEHAPRCPNCAKAAVRPDVVWFGEALPPDALERAFDVAQRCDVMLVVGTSGIVQPAASLPSVVRQAGATVVEVNPQESPITAVANVALRGPSGEMLPRLVAALWTLRGDPVKRS
jgi:NAD-dependent deacetylase